MNIGEKSIHNSSMKLRRKKHSCSIQNRQRPRNRVLFYLCITGVALVALAARLQFFYYGYTPDLVYNKYLYLARNMFSDEWWSGHVFFSSPGYQFFLYVLHRLIHLDTNSIRVVQIILGSIHCLLLSVVISRISSMGSGLLCGLMAALYGPFILHDVMLTTTCLDLLLNSFVLLFLLMAVQRHIILPLFLAGMMLGLGAIIRPNVLLLIGVTIGFYGLFPSFRRSFRISPRGLVLFLVGLILPILPVTIYNRVVGGEWVLITASAGNLIYSGNSYYANGLTYSPPESMLFDQNMDAIRRTSVLPVEHLMFWKIAREYTGQDLTAAQSNSFWIKETRNFVISYPKRAIELVLIKAYYFWNSYASHDISEITINERALSNWPFLGFSYVVPVSLAGLLLLFASGDWRRWIFPIIIITTYWLGTMLVFAVDRYRLPAFPYILAAGAWGCIYCFGEIRQRKYLKPILFLGFTLLFYFIVNFEPGEIRFQKQVSQPLFELEHRAIKAMKEQNFDVAEQLCNKMIEIDPGSAQLAHLNLSIIARARGDQVKARQEQHYARGYSQPKKGKSYYQDRLIEKASDHEALIALGCIEWKEGRQREALLYFGRAVEEAPWWPNGRFNRGIALLYKTPPNPRGARHEFETALEIGLKFSPIATDIHYHLGVAGKKLGDRERALREFRLVIQREPNHERAFEMIESLL